MRPAQLLAAVVTLSSLSAAWPWPPNVDDIKGVMGIENILYRRQNNNNDQTSSSATAKETTDKAKATTDTAAKTAAKTDKTDKPDSASRTAAKTTGTAAATTGKSAATETASKTGKQTGTDKSKGTATSKKTFGPTAGFGGISMITPAATDQASFYKIGDWVSFAWNYTSLSVTPKHINVLASCSKNQETYTLASNMSVEKTGMVYWDTGEYQKTATKSLIMETYTLIVYDADSSISATAAPGYLSVADTFYFGMYLPQAYTPRSEWSCAGCSAGNPSLERQTMGFLLGTFAITVISFTWFVIGAGVV
ncbi:hypothetical protein IWX49DRAFT_608342 [Phyllosticta citricarpa]|uniref:DUF7137 domain-containing protein n=1 Tax=Phyllosticta paracitricarpa TaxID=2016321 RepID=A0ABR1N0V4_9PEZI